MMNNRESAISRRGAGRLAGVSALAGILGAGKRANASAADSGGKVGTPVTRAGDEIVAAGQFFHTTAPVVTWMDPAGYDAYRVERRFAPVAESSFEKSRGNNLKSPNRYGMRTSGLGPDVVERVRGGGWDLETLRSVVDQFVIHYDVSGTSKRCFQVLHDIRGLSVHFLLDLDGTIYQTLDLKEAAWHATVANARSIGIEIANMGAYPINVGNDEANVLSRWYGKGPDGKTVITIPGGLAESGERKPPPVLRPSRDEPVVGEVQGQSLRQYDFTPEQYDSLIRLTATLCAVFPRIDCDYPRDPAGRLITRKLPDDLLRPYRGVLGHYHVQTNKTDPGPAFQWDRVIDGARALLKG